MSKYCEHLECLSNLASCERCDDRNCCDDDTCIYINTLNKAILKAKAFDIINKKSVDMFCLPFLIEKYGDNAINKYNLMNTGFPRLDQEEFDIIKQALEVDE